MINCQRYIIIVITEKYGEKKPLWELAVVSESNITNVRPTDARMPVAKHSQYANADKISGFVDTNCFAIVFLRYNVYIHPVATSDCPFENARLRDSGAMFCYPALRDSLKFILVDKRFERVVRIGIQHVLTIDQFFVEFREIVIQRLCNYCLFVGLLVPTFVKLRVGF